MSQHVAVQDPLIGAVAGGYRVVSLLSVGGMGSVYRAEHALIGRLAAIKVLLPEMSMNRDMVQRFFLEAKATTAIKHPGIVEVFDFGYLPSGQAYIVMELLEGMTLAQRIHLQGRMHEGEAAMILRSACGALAAAHATGVVHRDLKPDNIFLVPDLEAPIGVRCKLLDFGIAKLTAQGAATGMTQTGAVMGTPTYMSPEQCRGSGDVDARADLYSLGCIFYELVTGRPPFVCEGAGELLGSHLFVEPVPPSRMVQGITLEGETLILQLLAKLPARRVQSARELAARVSALAQAHGWGVSSTDLDARMSMASLAYTGHAPAEESTQLAPLPTPRPELLAPPVATPKVATPKPLPTPAPKPLPTPPSTFAEPDEATQPIAMPLPDGDTLVRKPAPAAAAVPAGRATKPMPTPAELSGGALLTLQPEPPAMPVATARPTPQPPSATPVVVHTSSLVPPRASMLAMQHQQQPMQPMQASLHQQQPPPQHQTPQHQTPMPANPANPASFVGPLPQAPYVPAHVPTPPPMAPYVPQRVPTPLPMAAYVPTPTTLSGAAREAVAMGPGKLRPGRIAVAFVLAGIVVGGVVYVAVGRDGGGPTRAAAGAMDAAVVAPPPPPTPTPPAVTPDAAASLVDAAEPAAVPGDAVAPAAIVLPAAVPVAPPAPPHKTPAAPPTRPPPPATPPKQPVTDPLLEPHL